MCTYVSTYVLYIQHVSNKLRSAVTCISNEYVCMCTCFILELSMLHSLMVTPQALQRVLLQSAIAEMAS